jgi:predicted nucleic acid-binding protein
MAPDKLTRVIEEVEQLSTEDMEKAYKRIEEILSTRKWEAIWKRPEAIAMARKLAEESRDDEVEYGFDSL